MIAKLTGLLDALGADSVVVDVGGVGYLVHCSARTLSRCPTPGQPLSLQIETHVREQNIQLFGFFDAAERDWFRRLTTVQGVGVKVALGIQSSLNAEELVQAVVAGDTRTIARAPGVGPKLAARIAAELRESVGRDIGPAAPAGGNAAVGDAVSALVNLGYGRSEAHGAVVGAAGELGEDAPVEDLVRAGLRRLAA